jgi:hypothetical protein
VIWKTASTTLATKIKVFIIRRLSLLIMVIASGWGYHSKHVDTHTPPRWCTHAGMQQLRGIMGEVP